MDLKYIYDNLKYDLIVDNVVKLHGDIDYVSSHFTDGNTTKLEISHSQNAELQPFIDGYFEQLSKEPNLTIENYYNRKAI